MLIYQAQIHRNTCLFSDFNAAKSWVEQNCDSGTWKQNSVDSWVLNSNVYGDQLAIVFATMLETNGEKDPLRQLAFAILDGDPMALDAARDILTC